MAGSKKVVSKKMSVKPPPAPEGGLKYKPKRAAKGTGAQGRRQS